jgi:hypothetical protein
MAEWLQDPSVGQWFRTDDEPFEIVGVDVQAEVVLVQHYDGTLEEFDFDNWLELSAQPCAPPEDYSGALDIEPDDYGLEREALSPRSARGGNPLDELDLGEW